MEGGVRVGRARSGERRCPLCLADLPSDAPIHTCGGCGTAVHAACFRELSGCATRGCDEARPDRPAPAVVAREPVTAVTYPRGDDVPVGCVAVLVGASVATTTFAVSLAGLVVVLELDGLAAFMLALVAGLAGFVAVFARVLRR